MNEAKGRDIEETQERGVLRREMCLDKGENRKKIKKVEFCRREGDKRLGLGLDFGRREEKNESEKR